MISHDWVGLLISSFVDFLWPHFCSCAVLVGQLDLKVQGGFIFGGACSELRPLGSPTCDLSSNGPDRLLSVAALGQHP